MASPSRKVHSLSAARRRAFCLGRRSRRSSVCETATPAKPPRRIFRWPASSAAPPYLVSVRPLARAAGDAQQRGRAVAMVFVRDTLRQDTAGVRLLAEIFGLTPAEAGLARAIQAGVPLDQYAARRAVTLNTVYTHLRRIKEKTGCKRMSELIRKLNDLQVLLRQG